MLKTLHIKCCLRFDENSEIYTPQKISTHMVLSNEFPGFFIMANCNLDHLYRQLFALDSLVTMVIVYCRIRSAIGWWNVQTGVMKEVTVVSYTN